jgi:predicted MFS family arabinose efflux permease
MNSRDIRLLGLVAFASMVSMRMCDPMLLQWAMDFNVSQGQASHVIAAFSIAYGVMQLIYGPLGQRLGIIKLITWAAGISAILSILTAFSSGLDALLIARSAMGGVAAAIIPLSMAWIGDQVAYDSRQQTLARLMSATVTGVMAGQWFGGFAAQYLGWRWAFGALSVLFALAFVLLYRSSMYRLQTAVAQQTKVSAADYLRGTRNLLYMTSVQRVLLLTLLEGALAFGVLVFVPSMLINDFSLSSSYAGAAMLLYGIGGLMYSQFAKRWITKLGQYRKPKKKQNPIQWAGPVLAGEQLWLAGSNRELVAVDPYEGKRLITIRLKAPAYLPPVVAGGMAYVLTDDGTLTAYR